MPTIHLIHGYLGSGKTTFARRLEAETGGLRISIDDWTSTLSNDPVHRDRELFERVWRLMAHLWPSIAQSGTQDVILDFGSGRASNATTRAVVPRKLAPKLACTT